MKNVDNKELAARIEQATMTAEQMNNLLCVDLLKAAALAKKNGDTANEKASSLSDEWLIAAKKAGLTPEMLCDGAPLRGYINSIIAGIRFSTIERKLLDTPKAELSESKQDEKKKLQTKLRAHVQYFVIKLKGEKKTAKTAGGTSKAAEGRGKIEIAVERLAMAIKDVRASETPTQAELDTLAAFEKSYDMACKIDKAWKARYSITQDVSH